MITDEKYFLTVIDIILEIGIKLGIVIWRKINKDGTEQADAFFSSITYDFIRNKRYKLAQRLLEFGVKMPKIFDDNLKRIMIVNLANSYKLGGNQHEAINILSKYDWSACGNDFKISVAAVRGDLSEVLSLMGKIGNNGSVTKEDYLEWPVLLKMREKREFKAKFEEIFGENLEMDIQDSVNIEEEEKSINNEKDNRSSWKLNIRKNPYPSPLDEKDSDDQL